MKNYFLDTQIIRVPLGLGVINNKGLELGPCHVENHLRKRIKYFQLDGTYTSTKLPFKYKINDFHEGWEIEIPKVKQTNDPIYESVRHLLEINIVCKSLRDKVIVALKQKKTPIIIGGDHSISIGSIAGVANFYSPEEIGVIWIDSHPDYNTGIKGEQIGHKEYESFLSPSNFTKKRIGTTTTGDIHGMSLAVCVGKGENELTSIYNKNFINPKNIIVIGLRDLEREERESIHSDGLKIFSSRQIEFQGISKISKHAILYLKERGIKKVHISFDIDSIERISVPGTGNPTSGGMSFREADFLIKLLRDWLPLNKIKISSFEIVEVNPETDKDQITVEIAARLLSTFLGEEIIDGDRFDFNSVII